MLTPVASPTMQSVPTAERKVTTVACLWGGCRTRQRKLAVRRQRLQRWKCKAEAAARRLLRSSVWTLLGAAEKQKIVRHVHKSIQRLLLGQVPDEETVARRIVLDAFEAHIKLFRFDGQADESLPHELLNLGHKKQSAASDDVSYSGI